jgi:hypothetical protein
MSTEGPKRKFDVGAYASKYRGYLERVEHPPEDNTKYGMKN